MPLPLLAPALGMAFRHVLITSLIPVLLTLVGVVVNSLSGGAVSSALLSIVFAPVNAVLNTVFPSFSVASLLSAVPSDVWGFLTYIGLTPAFNFFFGNAVLLLTGYISAIFSMHLQAFFLRSLSVKKINIPSGGGQ